MEGLSGAGGNWQVIDEIADEAVVKQQDKLSCGPACGEMLLSDRGIGDVNQSLIAAETGVPVSIEDLSCRAFKLHGRGGRDAHPTRV